jgi:hypothetical protein
MIDRNILVAGVLVFSMPLAGCSSGMKAIMNSDADQLQRVLDRPNHGNEDLNNLECYAVTENCAACVMKLLQAGAKPDCLTHAALNGAENISRILIENGAEPSISISDISALPVLSGYSAGQTQAAENLLNRIAQERTQAPLAAAPTNDSVVLVHSKLVPDFHVPEHPDDYALIVGVEKYDDLPAATFSESDAATAAGFVRALGVPARNVVTLTGAHATRSGMVKQLENWLAKNADADSTVYFYFSGHGAPDPATGQAYLVPFDGDPQYLAETAYPLKRLYEKLGALKAKRTIVMLDSCFSGAGGRSVLAKGARPLVNNIDTGFNSADGKIAVLTASGANQISGTSDELGHGLFTYYLFNGLNGAAKDESGRVTIRSLYDYLKPKVMDDARRANGDQTPQLQTRGMAIDDMVLRGK